MKIAIVGPGATGCLFAALLSEAGHECVLLDKHEHRAKIISSRGIKIEGVSGNRVVQVPATVSPNTIPPPELVMICVKTFDTAAAASKAAILTRKNTTVLTTQNGLGNIEQIRENTESKTILAGVTTQGATLLGPGHVFHAGAGETTLGPASPKQTGVAKRLASMFSDAGIPATSVQDVKSVIWSKLIINAAIGPVTALYNLPNGKVLEQEEPRRLLRSAAKEAFAVARAATIPLLYSDAIKATEDVCMRTSSNASSMLQDVREGRRTEVEEINGAIVDYGQRVSIQTPVNKDLLNRILEKIPLDKTGAT